MRQIASLRDRGRRYRTRWVARGTDPEQAWAGALGDELEFWRDWLATHGARWPEDYKFRLDPESVIQDTITRWLGDPGPVVRLLDAGAGPLTVVGKQWSGHDLEITAVDALAAEYGGLLAAAMVTPPVRTQACETEHLTSIFAPGSFDVAYALNTLDHSYDPLACIQEMVTVVRPGGTVLLQHYPNEAEHEGYAGLHQWNFDWAHGDCVLWRPGKRWHLAAEFAGTGAVTGEKAGDVVTTVIHKNP